MKSGSTFGLVLIVITAGIVGIAMFMPWANDATYGVHPVIGLYLMGIAAVAAIVLVNE